MDHASKQQIGGLARAAALSPERRAEIARQAAATRWAKPRPPKVIKPPKDPKCVIQMPAELWAFAEGRAAVREITLSEWMARMVRDVQKRQAAESPA